MPAAEETGADASSLEATEPSEPSEPIVGSPEELEEQAQVASEEQAQVAPPEPAQEPSPELESPAPIALATADAAPPSDTQPSSPSMLAKSMVSKASAATEPLMQPAGKAFTTQEPAAPAEEEAFPLALTLRTEAPKVAQASKAVPVKVEEAVKAAPKSEPARVEAQKKAEEPGKAAPKAEESRKAAPKAEEPRKAAPKAEEPRKAAPKAEEPRKAAPKAEEPRSVPGKKSARTEGDPSSRKPASLRAVRDGEGASKATFDDELDPSSISAEFFRKDQDSVPPVEEHDDHEEVAPVLILSPSTLARRARLRRMVAGVVAFAGVISIAVVGKQVFASKRPVSAMPALVIEQRHDVAPTPPEVVAPKAVAEPQKVAVAEPAKVDGDPKGEKADDKKVDDKKPDDKKDAVEAKKDDGKKDEAEAKKDDGKKDEAEAKKDEKPAPSGADAGALKKEAESLLNRGRNKEAAEKAREAIAADPSDAISYLYLGTALQSSGKWKDGVDAYCECVRNATEGPRQRVPRSRRAQVASRNRGGGDAQVALTTTLPVAPSLPCAAP